MVARFLIAMMCFCLVGSVGRADDTQKPVDIPKGMRAVAVKVKKDAVADGFILPGSKVDVIVTEGKGKKKKSSILLQNVLVLAVGWTGVPGDLDEKEREAQKEITIITVALIPEDHLKLVLAAQKHEIRMALRAPDDKNKK